MRGLTRRCFDTLPDFGHTVAIDSTDIKAWSNGGKKGKNRKVSDPDAGWCAKQNTAGKTKYTWGYKAHILCDTHYELPITVITTAGNVHDSKKAKALLRQGTYTDGRCRPRFVTAEKGYCSKDIRRFIRKYHAVPVIDPNPAHKKASAETIRTPEWQATYKSRVAIERLNGRLKNHRRLDSVRVRGRFKVRTHVLFSIIVLQAQALATGSRMSVRAVA